MRSAMPWAFERPAATGAAKERPRPCSDQVRAGTSRLLSIRRDPARGRRQVPASIFRDRLRGHLKNPAQRNNVGREPRDKLAHGVPPLDRDSLSRIVAKGDDGQVQKRPVKVERDWKDL